MLGTSDAAAVRAAIPAEVLERIDHGPKTAFLPLELDVFIVDAVGDVAGFESLDRWARESMRASTRGPLIRPLVDGARRVFGLTVNRMVRHMLPRTFVHLYRDSGHFEVVDETEDSMTLVYRDVPPVITDSRWYLTAIASSLTIALEVSYLNGRVVLDRRRTEPVILFDWSPTERPGVAVEVLS